MTSPQPSLRQLAKELGVSPSLVSLVLNDRWRENSISEQTQRRVLKRLEELNYRPNRLAISLRQQKTETIGVIIPVLATFYEDVLRGVQRAVGADYVLNLGVADYHPATERRLVVSFLERRVDGLVIVPTGDAALAPLLEEVQQKQVPLVLVDRYYPQVKSHYVGSDHTSLGVMAAEHLLDVGYRNLACLTAAPVSASTMLQGRLTRVRAVVERESCPFHLFEGNVVACGFDPAPSAARALEEILARFERPVGVFVISSIMAEAFYRACRKQGLRVPEDIGILSVDQPRNTDDLYGTPLSTIRQQTERMGEVAGRYLSEMIDGKRSPAQAEHLQLPVELVPLRSTQLRGPATAPEDPGLTPQGETKTSSG